eukprot:gnl/MRDRNA2_/MRDRNA2_26859_c0_seq1.p1 gnl/MRDRNA2_/MRDRNA2_26859_c0~~gnl/MRDRNA2_/MRDRNA2_26859_c0_seq1.p1  ORF type:complete len:230 (+),score=31.36 gnl/MRDRNA2_/MRDRNA2_26859_c0_seq1:44-733(+)
MVIQVLNSHHGLFEDLHGHVPSNSAGMLKGSHIHSVSSMVNIKCIHKSNQAGWPHSCSHSTSFEKKEKMNMFCEDKGFPIILPVEEEEPTPPPGDVGMWSALGSVYSAKLARDALHGANSFQWPIPYGAAAMAGPDHNGVGGGSLPSGSPPMAPRPPSTHGPMKILPYGSCAGNDFAGLDQPSFTSAGPFGLPRSSSIGSLSVVEAFFSSISSETHRKASYRDVALQFL